MSADNGPQDRDGEGASGISRREVLLTVGGVAAAVGAGAAIWAALSSSSPNSTPSVAA